MRGPAIRLIDTSHQGFEAAGGSNGATAQRSIRFGQCVVRPGARSLERYGQPLELGSRGFDLLMVLLQSRGRIVTKEEIMRYVWPSTIVEDANLRVQMACLRRVLGRDGKLILTIPRRGYMAVAEDDVPAAPIAAASPQTNGVARARPPCVRASGIARRPMGRAVPRAPSPAAGKLCRRPYLIDIGRVGLRDAGGQVAPR